MKPQLEQIVQTQVQAIIQSFNSKKFLNHIFGKTLNDNTYFSTNFHFNRITIILILNGNNTVFSNKSCFINSLKNVMLVTMVTAVTLVHCVMVTRSSQLEVTPLTVTQRCRVMVFPMRRMLNTQPVVSNTQISLK